MKNYQDYLKYKQQLNESTLSRIWQHIQSDISFGVVSSFKDEYKLETNLSRYEQLKKLVKDMGYGYIQLNSGYTYQNVDNKTVFAKEKSLFIPEITKKDILTPPLD